MSATRLRRMMTCLAAALAGCERPQSAPVATAPATAPTTAPSALETDRAPLHWDRPRTADRQAERDRMVRRQIVGASAPAPHITDPRVIAALRAVPRHEFVPAELAARAYDDTPLPIGSGQTISQPYIVALMTDLLRIKPGDKVLEIGTGSGYQAAVLAELTPDVFTIEIVAPLYERAVAAFQRLGYRTIQVRLGDGYDGWPEHAPFDAIILTCAPDHVPPRLWDQLKPGGRMVLPVGDAAATQSLLVLTKAADGSRKEEDVIPVRFVPMTGKAQSP